MHPYFTPDAIDKFWSRVDRSGGPDACWPWTRGRFKAGYGSLYVGGGRKNPKHIATHVFSYILAYGPLDADHEVCHRCDYPACVNPAHLFAASHADNMRDMREKGRGSAPPRHAIRVRGEQTPSAKLTEDDVRAIRARYSPGRRTKERAARQPTLGELAAEYGVSDMVIHNVAARKTWKHVT